MRKTLLLLPLALLAACGDKGDDTGGSGLTGDATAGESVFASNCAACHGTDASGGSGPDLGAHVPGMSDSEIQSVIENGEGLMPAISTLSDQDIADVIAWLRGEFG
jgi:mono/diheme cytochrome c family protein